MSYKLKKFINNKNHTIDDYLKLSDEDALSYDFSNDGANYKYRNLEGSYKFLAYMIVRKKNSFDLRPYNGFDYEYFKKARDDVGKIAEKYGEVIDPDSKSSLLQEIYRNLWIDKYSNIFSCINSFYGETLNSANTTLEKFFKYKEKSIKDKRERSSFRNGKQRASINYVLSRYVNNDSNVVKAIIKDEDFKYFVNSYHTLGNFMPIPKGCNAPRGTGNIKDYFDLTLYIIHNYYFDGNSRDFKYIFSSKYNDEKKRYIEWLDSFGIGQDGWNNFVKSNFFGDLNVNGKLQENFVELKSDGNYGMPRELWDKHFDKFKSKRVVLPKDEECIEYFRNANKWIHARGLIMLDKLKSK